MLIEYEVSDKYNRNITSFEYEVGDEDLIEALADIICSSHSKELGENKKGAKLGIKIILNDICGDDSYCAMIDLYNEEIKEYFKDEAYASYNM